MKGQAVVDLKQQQPDDRLYDRNMHERPPFRAGPSILSISEPRCRSPSGLSRRADAPALNGVAGRRHLEKGIRHFYITQVTVVTDESQGCCREIVFMLS